MDLSKAHHFFSSTFTCLRGFSFKAQLLAAPMEESAVYFLLPRRILKLDAKSPVRPGDVIRSGPSGNMWLCAENGPSEFQNRTIYKTLKLFEVTHPAAQWTGSTTTVDPLTEQKRKTGNDLKGAIPVVIEFMKLQEDEMRIPADMVRIIAAENILVGDRVDGYTIINVEDQLGLKFCTAKRQ